MDVVEGLGGLDGIVYLRLWGEVAFGIGVAFQGRWF